MKTKQDIQNELKKIEGDLKSSIYPDDYKLTLELIQIVLNWTQNEFTEFRPMEFIQKRFFN